MNILFNISLIPTFLFFIDGKFSIKALLEFLDSIDDEDFEQIFTKKELQGVNELLTLLSENTCHDNLMTLSE